MAHVLNHPVSTSQRAPRHGINDVLRKDPDIVQESLHRPHKIPSRRERLPQQPLAPPQPLEHELPPQQLEQEQVQDPQHTHPSENNTFRHYYYHRPELWNPAPTPPRATVTKTQFVDVLDDFVSAQPPSSKAKAPVLVNRIRHLLDHLDALVEQLTLRVTNTLFDQLSHPDCLEMLLFLLSDVSARSSPVVSDVRKSYRYPYLVANILANGTMGIRDAFLSSTPLVTHLLSFLDGSVVLSTSAAISDGYTSSPASNQTFARENPIIVGNVVQILVSYMETSPEALLQVFRNRPTFISSIVNLLHIGSVPQLLSCLIPDRCVDDLTSMDPGNVSFDAPMTLALAVLADGAVLHHLSNAFVSATQTIFSSVGDRASSDPKARHDAEQMSFNIVQVYGTLINKTIRAVRLQPSFGPCQYLNVFGTANSASTISLCLKAGIDLFRETDGKEVNILNHALELTVDLLKYVEHDSERRVASVTGQPPLLDTSALETELEPLFKPLVEVLIDTVGTGPKHGQTRLRILEMCVECQRVCSERLVECFDRVRFGEVALKIMLLNPRNSLMQHVVCRGVESALVNKYRTGAFVHHWLVKSKLLEKIVSIWRNKGGDAIWKNADRAQEAPYLSALVHMACCAQHWMAVQRETPGSAEGAIPSPDPVRSVVGEKILGDFERFCKTTVDVIMETENGYLGGPRPRRRATRASGAGMGRSFGAFGATSAAVLRRTGSGNGNQNSGGQNRAHLVRSPSAHRFGYVAPVTSARSRLDDMFIEDDMTEGGGFGTTDAATSFASIFNSESESDAL